MQHEPALNTINLGLPAEATEALELALGLFGGNKAATLNWLNTPVLGLGNKKPADLLHTPEGRQQVIKLIWNLENGVGV